MPETKKRDIVTPIAVTAGAVAVGTGIYFYMKKPKGVDPGETFTVQFAFAYNGDGGDYFLQVSLGHVRIMEPFFDHIEGLTWTLEIQLPPGPQDWEFIVPCKLPLAVATKVYDGETLIRTPDMDWLDYIEDTKIVTRGAITVRKE